MERKHKSDESLDTEQMILQAAEREFMSKGFAGARTIAIAEAAGVTHAMLHYYFRTKEKLFDRILRDKITLLKSALVDSVSDLNLSLEEMIRNVIDKHLDFMYDNPELPSFIIREMHSGSTRINVIKENIKRFSPILISALQYKIDKGVEKGELRRVDPKMLILDIISLNLFSFVAAPAVSALLGEGVIASDDFKERRKRDNYDTIIRKLRV